MSKQVESKGSDGSHLADLLTRANSEQPLISEVAQAARQHLGMDISFLAEFQGDVKRLVAVSGEPGPLGFEIDAVIPLEDTYCLRVVRGESSGIIPATDKDPVVRDLPITHERSIGSYIGVPVMTGGGELYGTLCCISKEPTPGLAERDRNFLKALAQLIASQLDRQRQDSELREEKISRVQAVIDSGGPKIAYQPIVDLETGAVVGVEALSRFEEGRPDIWFSQGWEVGLGLELELSAIRKALKALPLLPEDVYISVNLAPDTLHSGQFLQELEGEGSRRVVVEITEHAAIEEFDQILSAIEDLRDRGARLAVDDLGAGYAGLSQALRLAPEILKLDNFLVSGIESDPPRQALAFAASSFSTMTRGTLVAEGIETREALETLSVLGVRYGQGFYLGHPQIDPDWDVFLQIPRTSLEAWSPS